MNERFSLPAWLAVLALLGGCGGAAKVTEGDMPPLHKAQTLVYECGDYEFVARTGPSEITLYLPGEYRVLSQVRSGSGTRYQLGEISFHSQGESAQLDLGTRQYRDCILNRARAPWEEARRRGVDFRAVGQEPAWQLEIQHDRQMLMIADYGSRRILLPTPEPELLEGYERYSVQDQKHQLQVDIEHTFCSDSMSGEVFDHRVEVNLDGSLYQGCGTSLESWWD
ncbi:MAG: MliC family protein [Halieaceae bacterium]